MRYVWIMLLLGTLCTRSLAQELFIQTEPASNMPKGGIGIRLTDRISRQNAYINSWLAPELMAGVTKNVMLHAGVYVSDHPHRDMALNGGFVYGKYRLYTYDEVQKHLRMAVFGRAANSSLYNVNDKRSPGGIFTAELDGYFSGYELGTVATGLFHKTALSLSTSYSKLGSFAAFYSGSGFQYALSAGYLLLPRQYKSYRQVNVNIYAELLGFYNTPIHAQGITIIPENYFTEVAPGIQFIINSQTRIDIAYRTRLSGKIAAQQSNYTVLLRLEHTLFNVW